MSPRAGGQALSSRGMPDPISLELALGMTIALLLIEPFPGLSIVRGVFILPWAIPNIVVAWLMRMYLQPRFGLFNQIIGWAGNTLGLHEGYFLWDWLGNPATALITVSLIITWKGLPFVILVLLAGLQAIPREIGEAARIDGANAWQEFRYVTLPSLRLIIVDTRGDDLHELRQRISNHTAGDAGVQIGSGRAERQSERLHAAQASRTAGFAAGHPDSV